MVHLLNRTILRPRNIHVSGSMSQPVQTYAPSDAEIADFVANVRSGLTQHDQKTLDSKYFYDQVGSALFEVITLLPEYGLARADERLIDRHAAEIVGRLHSNVVVAELGSGSGTKTRRILFEIAGSGSATYFPIDLSRAALNRCQQELQDIDRVRIEPLVASYMDGLREAMTRTPANTQFLLLFLGSTIGNFERTRVSQFLRDVRGSLREGDVFFIGADLEKPIPQVLAAYDDPLGVTAAFNLNVLARINRELDGNFDLDQFEHVALYEENERRVEMHLRARQEQEVRIGLADLKLTISEGETIWTESSHKFNCEEIARLAADSGFRCVDQWLDDEWPFAENVLVAN